jgi:hypothetical protein
MPARETGNLLTRNPHSIPNDSDVVRMISPGMKRAFKIRLAGDAMGEVAGTDCFP